MRSCLFATALLVWLQPAIASESFWAECRTRGGSHPFSWTGTVRASRAEAQRDADTHNRENPGHGAAVRVYLGDDGDPFGDVEPLGGGNHPTAYRATCLPLRCCGQKKPHREWTGPLRPTKEEAQLDADEHNRQFPDHGARVVEASFRPSAGDSPYVAAELTGGQIVSSMGTARAGVKRCFERYKVSGVAQVITTVSPEGAVTAARTSGELAGTAMGKCIEDAVKKTRFPSRPGKAQTFTYPFVLR